jgi:TolB-like protein
MNIGENMNFLTKTWVLTLLVMLCGVLPAAAATAEQPGKTVAILPFSLNAPPEMQYLREGLRDILASRLRVEAGAAMIANSKADEALRAAGGRMDAATVREVARRLAADYLIHGSITALGGGISIDARVFSAAAPPEGAEQQFYGSALTNDQIMQSVDTLAWDIIERLFDRKRPAAMMPAQAASPAQGASEFTTVHPDKTFMTTGGGYGLSSRRNFTKTRNFDMEIRGIDLGDIDGDGQPEVIIAEKTAVHVFNRDGTRLNLIGTIAMGNRYHVHSVNAADLDGNGRAEIYISASDPSLPGSRGVEWDGKQFVDLFTEARWYIRPIDIPGTGPVLVGQAAGQVPIVPGIYQLSLRDGKLSMQEQLPIPAEVNVFNFAYADADGDGQQDLVVLDNSFKLQLIKNGSVIWKSQERFGGTKRYIGGDPNIRPGTNFSRADIVDGIGELYKQTYVPSRILVADVDRDGIDDIIVNRNPETLTAVVPRMVQYTSGTMVGLRWNGLGLEEMWRTRKIDGYVVDYQVKSLAAAKPAADDMDELFIGVVLNTGTLESLTGSQSTVVIYPFEFEEPESR